MQNTHKEDSTSKTSVNKKVGDSSHPKQSTPTGNQQHECVWDNQKIVWLFVVGAVSLVVRLNAISHPSETSFEESSMGEFISNYMKREFFIEVHPPLSKLLYAAVASLFGYDGSFEFLRVGQSYAGSTVPYVALRVFSAICGSLTVMAVYATLIEMKFFLSVALLGSCMVAFDNALVIKSRFILKDSQFLLFLILACLCWVKFRSLTKTPFSPNWWLWLSATGVFLGSAMGVQITGFFVVAIVGACTVFDLWDVSGISRTAKHITVLHHWLARILCLIIVPIACFLLPFFIHLSVLTNSGSSDTYMTNEFQSTLAGNEVTKLATPIFYGSTLKIINKAEVIYLHSHRHHYPHKHEGKVSSQGQQVTGYSHPDENNDWMIVPEIEDPPIDYINNRIMVKNNDVIRLKHLSTKKYLASHNVASTLTNTNQEVTAYSANHTADEEYNKTTWVIRITGTDELFNKVSYFELEHKLTGAYLMNHKENLPEWGYKQREINSGRNRGDKSLWRVEKVTPKNAQNEEVDTANYTGFEYKDKLSLWKKFVEFFKLPYDRKSPLLEPSPYLAAPTKWPLLTQGINYWSSEDKLAKVYLICNPLTWYLCILSLPAIILLAALDIFVYLRGGEFLHSKEKRTLYLKGLFFLGCFFSNYFFFAGMGKPVFLCNYMPCYLFNILVFTTVYQIAALRFKILNNPAVVGVICSLIVGVFANYSALTYGTTQSEDYFKALRTSRGWHL
eukprot:CAMPEP_0176412884 /NCGR_PEP_ID=MMETSP0127-20121128/4387_1 /TAXON_ID=938130 /ORGANISM="Platyophrya macrostoma, Strain WH" /LENGTH=730 /DNA_ID=CAMNT_0017792595 /DNA_START=1 /DNA_END=2196 /DNA_ORIENTATION=+